MWSHLEVLPTTGTGSRRGGLLVPRDLSGRGDAWKGRVSDVLCLVYVVEMTGGNLWSLPRFWLLVCASAGFDSSILDSFLVSILSAA